MNTSPLEKKLLKEHLKAIVSAQMFCKFTGEVLDTRTCILVEAYKDGKFDSAIALSPKMADQIPTSLERAKARGLELKHFTLNKNIQLP